MAAFLAALWVCLAASAAAAESTVVEIERTDPASAFVEANGEDGIAVFARLRRRQVGDSGGDEMRNPGRSRAVDLEAVRFSDAPVDLALAFGPTMAAYEVNGREIRIEGVDVNDNTPIELEILAQWVRGTEAGEPREGIEIRIEPHAGANVMVTGRLLDTDDNGTARGGSGALPTLPRPGEGEQRLADRADDVDDRPGDEIFDERVEEHGGQTGDTAATLIWNNGNDLDLHVVCPDGTLVYYANPQACGIALDVDMNDDGPESQTPVENVHWSDTAMPGAYKVVVDYFNNHGGSDPTSYRVRVIVNGEEQIFEGSISGGEHAITEFTIP